MGSSPPLWWCKRWSRVSKTSERMRSLIDVKFFYGLLLPRLSAAAQQKHEQKQIRQFVICLGLLFLQLSGLARPFLRRRRPRLVSRRQLSLLQLDLTLLLVRSVPGGTEEGEFSCSGSRDHHHDFGAVAAYSQERHRQPESVRGGGRPSGRPGYKGPIPSSPCRSSSF